MPIPIFVFGTVVIDRIRRIKEIPREGEYCEYWGEQQGVGGEAANTAAWLENWGIPTYLLGNSIGDTDESRWLADQIAALGIHRSHFEPGSGSVPACDIYVTQDGERTMFGRGWDDLGSPLPEIESEWITLDPNRRRASQAAIMEASARNMNIYAMDFDPATAKLPPNTYLQISADTYGIHGQREAIMTRAGELARSFQGHVLMTDGHHGCAYAGPLGDRWTPQFQIEDAVDATGSGDAFRAGMLYGLSQQLPLDECLVFASAAGALNCLSIGATANLPSKAAVLGFIQSQASKKS